MKNGMLLIPLLLAGCTSIETLRPDIAARPAPSRLDEIAYINVLREAYARQAEGRVADGYCYDGKGLRRFNPTLAQGYNDHTGSEDEVATSDCVFYKDLSADPARGAKIKRYVEARFGITDLYCERFFTIANESAQKRRFQRNAGTSLDGLVGSVLSLSSAGATATGIVNAGFAALDSTYQNIDDSFLIAPDLGNVRKLVHAAQLDYRDQAFSAEKLPTSYPAARTVIERYAGLCSFSGMKQLVNDSVTDQTQMLKKAGRSDGDEEDADKGAGTEARPMASESVPTSGTKAD